MSLENLPADGGVGARPDRFTITVQGGMLEALGINMYTSIGKCLAEFVANAYDSDSTRCTITLPFDEIDAARAEVRVKAKQAVAAGTRAAFTVLLDPLPNELCIEIEDDGHGMSAREVQDKFLPINRHRRGADNRTVKSESGNRFVMGRKGLGKLAGFGAAERVTIRTKRAGDDYATEISLDHTKLSAVTDIQEHPIEFKYHEGEAADIHGTKIVLAGLRCDAMKSKEGTITESLLETFFGIRPDDFAIYLNAEDPLAPGKVIYEYIYPEERDDEDLGSYDVALEDGESLALRYAVMFRARRDDPHDAAADGERGPLPAKRRGARVYCNKRLAAGPTLFDLPTGMHNFHSQSYMECIVEADELDQHDVDLINTNRSDLRRDNDLIDNVVASITELMKKALAAHATFRERKADKDLEDSLFSGPIMKTVAQMPRKQSEAAKKVLRTLAATGDGPDSEAFKETAPLILNSMNAGQVLIRLIELGADPTDLTTVVRELVELGNIEKNDALKLYRGRRGGIRALQKLMERGDDEWKASQRFENELHELLKSCPWLIRPEYTQYLTSNQTMATLATSLSKALQVDEYSPADPDSRPDLVFLMQDSLDVHTVVVVELKSPNVALDQDALSQLERYMELVRPLAKGEVGRDVKVIGFLVGSPPDGTTKNPKELVLLKRYHQQTGDGEFSIITLRDMFNRAYTINIAAIEILEAEEAQ